MRAKVCLGMMVVAFSGLWFACGDPTDDPEDCTSNEFFDPGDKRCKTCPAVDEPDCGDGCGFTVETDEQGCPVAECDLTCAPCPTGTSYSEETLQCEPDPN